MESVFGSPFMICKIIVSGIWYAMFEMWLGLRDQGTLYVPSVHI